MSFTLPTLEELQKRMNAEAEFKDDYLHSLTSAESEQVKLELEIFEQEHEVQLPKSFKQVIQTYNFISFNTGVLWLNPGKGFISGMNRNNNIGGIAGSGWQWARKDKPIEPSGLVWIGGGDLYQFVLDLKTGAIAAYIWRIY